MFLRELIAQLSQVINLTLEFVGIAPFGLAPQQAGLLFGELLPLASGTLEFLPLQLTPADFFRALGFLRSVELHSGDQPRRQRKEQHDVDDDGGHENTDHLTLLPRL